MTDLSTFYERIYQHDISDMTRLVCQGILQNILDQLTKGKTLAFIFVTNNTPDVTSDQRYAYSEQTVKVWSKTKNGTWYHDPQNQMANYNNESVIWLDEFRAHTMTIHEWIPILQLAVEKDATIVVSSPLSPNVFFDTITDNHKRLDGTLIELFKRVRLHFDITVTQIHAEGQPSTKITS